MQKFAKSLFAIVSVVVLVLVMSTPAFAQSEAQVRFVHAFVDAPNVDIAVNGEIVATDVPFGAASDFVETTSGEISITLSATGETAALFEQTFTLGAEPLTLVISSDAGFTPFVENVDPLNVGQARITAIHAINGAPEVDVVLADGRPVIAGLAYNTPYGTLDVPVLNFALNVVPSGATLSDAIFAEPFNAPLASGTSYTAIVYGTLDAPEVMLLAAPVLPQAGDGFLQVTHNVEGAPAVDVYANSVLLIPGLAEGASTVAFPVPADDYNVQVVVADTTDIVAEGDLTISTGATTLVTAVADGEGIALEVEAEEAPVASSEVVGAPTTESEVVAVAPTPAVAVPVPSTPVPAAIAVPAATEAPLPTARVQLDAGANLQLRQYPNSTASSLGLVPSGATLTVLGREGAPVQIQGLFSQEIQDEIDAYVDPAEDLPADQDLNPNNTWLKVSYTTPDNGVIEAWVSAQFLLVSTPNSTRQRLADLPTIPRNAFGEAVGTAVTPPPVNEDAVTAVVFNLDPGVNLKIRRTPDTLGETLALIPAGTVLEFVGLEISPDEEYGIEAAENAEWVFIRYSAPEGAQITGWVSTLYVQFFWRGERIDFEEMDARTLLLFEDPNTRGTLGAGAVALPTATVDPLRDQYVGTVVLNAGANLQFRRDADPFSESLALIPSGTELIVQARTEAGDWLLVNFDGTDGWISSQFVRLSFNGALVTVDNVPVQGAESAQ